MRCHHLSIRRKITGNESTCILCRRPVIFDAQRWVQLYSVSPFDLALMRFRYANPDASSADCWIAAIRELAR